MGESLRDLRARLAAVEANDPVEAARVRERILEAERVEATQVRVEEPVAPEDTAVERRPAARGQRRVKGE